MIVAALFDTCDFYLNSTLLYRVKILLWFVNGTIIGKIPLLVAGLLLFFIYIYFLVGARYLR